MIFAVVLIILCNQSVASSKCNRSCPSDKPYCNDVVGCIFECPEPFYINDNNCVSDCGEMFVDEHRKCIGSCPENTFYKETLKQSMSTPYLERKCVRCDKFDDIVSNASCVKVCPSDSRYIDKQKCVSECPNDRPYRMNTTVFGLLHHKCVGKCPRIEDDGFCRIGCPQNKVAFNSSCYEQCPASRPFISSKTCRTKCTDDAPAAGFDNKTCVHRKCPDERPVVVNSTCVDRCPVGFHFILSTYNGISGFKYCVKDCGDKYKFGDQCVDTCPLSTVAVNNTCLEKCPRNTSYSCMIKKGFQCGEKPEQKFDHAICVDVCPRPMLRWRKTCIYSCPHGVPLFENECTEKCPVDYPYERNITKTTHCYSEWCEKVESVLTCIKECPSKSYLSNYSCLSYCPSFLFHNERDCVLKCPASEPLVQNVTITLYNWSYHIYYFYSRKYTQTESNKIMQKCVTDCDKEMVRFNFTCITSCPEDYPIIQNGSCSQQKCETKYSENISAGIICVEKCKPHQFVLNETCVNTCPDIYLYFNGTCVDRCPRSHNYTGVSVVNETCHSTNNYCTGNIILNCTESCPDGSFEYNGTCERFCHTPLFTIENKCVASCPTGAPYQETSSISVTNRTFNSDGIRFWKENVVQSIVKCKAKCSDDKLILGSKCVLQCPDDMYVLARNCITMCPSTQGLINIKTIVNHQYNCTYGLCAKGVIDLKECRQNCPENKFLFNNTCHDICLINTSIYKNTCVAICPQSHPYTEPATISILKWTRGHWFWNKWYIMSEDHKVNNCVSQCSNNYPLQFNYSCIKKCPGECPYLVDNTCVEKCPESKLTDIRTKQCVDNCANDRGYFNKSCYYNCPETVRYIFDSRCVSQCPSSDPVALKEDRFICRKSCGDLKLFKDGKCVYISECEDPMFEYGVLCLHRCPEGFVWFDNCKNTLPVKIALAVLAVLVGLLFALSRHSLLDFAHVLRLTFLSVEKIAEMEKQLQHQCSKSKHKMNKKDDEISLQEFVLHPEN